MINVLPSPVAAHVATAKQVGDRLRMARLAQRRNQASVAEVIGIHQTALALVERGKRGLGLLEAVALCDNLGISLEELIKP